MKIKNGFSIIELLVAITIMITIFSAGIAKYVQFNRNQVLVQAAQELKSNLRFAQGKALSGEKDCLVCDGGNLICGDSDDLPLDFWCLSFLSQSYSLYGSCGAVQFAVKAVDMSDLGVSFVGSPSPICFSPLGQSVIGAKTLILQGTGVADPVSVTVTATGEIYYEGG